MDGSHLTDVHDALREAIEGGTPQQKKALLKALVAEIKVDGNEAAPLYRLPHAGVRIVGTLVDLSSHNANPPGVFDGEAVALSDVAEIRLEEAIASLREFVDDHGRLPTANSWTEARMRPSEKTIRRRFGSFKAAVQCAGIVCGSKITSNLAPHLVTAERPITSAG